MKMVHYIGYYTREGNPNEFIAFPSCNSKMGYVIDSLISEGFYVKILSLGESRYKSSIQHTIVYSDLLSVTYTSALKNQGIFSKVLSRLFLLAQVLYYLIFNIRRGESVIVYHSTPIIDVVRLVKFIKPSLHVIYEVEEIYAAVYDRGKKAIEREIKRTQFTDSYILVNDNLDRIYKRKFTAINTVVCYGNYNIVNNKKHLFNNPNQINLVYAGVIGGKNSDVYMAIEAMGFLPSKYKLFILGYGTDSNLSHLEEYIGQVGYNIQYDGLKTGNEYSEYLALCDIGLSPRLLDDELSNYTFPSKVLVYLTHGLITVSSKISCIVNSKVADNIYFIEDLTSEGLAKTIKRINVSNPKGVSDNLINRLDVEFRENLKSILI